MISRPDDAGNSNSDLAWLVNVFARVHRLYPLQIGGSLYRDTINTAGTAPRRFREGIVSAHIVYQNERPEVIAEWARVRHTESGAPSFTSEGYYIQVAYRFTESKYKPYFRYDRVSIPAGEPVFTQPSLRGPTLGVRYDISEFAALKFEYRSHRRSPAASFSGFFTQLCFAF